MYWVKIAGYSRQLDYAPPYAAGPGGPPAGPYYQVPGAFAPPQGPAGYGGQPYGGQPYQAPYGAPSNGAPPYAAPPAAPFPLPPPWRPPAAPSARR